MGSAAFLSTYHGIFSKGRETLWGQQAFISGEYERVKIRSVLQLTFFWEPVAIDWQFTGHGAEGSSFIYGGWTVNDFKPEIHNYRATFNPFISITPSKPLISSGPGITLNNFEICYFSAIYYINGIKITIYPGPAEEDLQLIFEPGSYIRVIIYPAALSQILTEVTIYFSLCHNIAKIQENRF